MQLVIAGDKQVLKIDQKKERFVISVNISQHL